MPLKLQLVGGSAPNLYGESQHIIAKRSQKSSLQSTSQLVGVRRGPELQQHTREDTLKRLRLNTTKEKELGLKVPSCGLLIGKAGSQPEQGGRGPDARVGH